MRLRVVRLSPDSRSVAVGLAATDTGRVMLTADLELKRTVARLMVPDNETGEEFWDSMRGKKYWPSFRTWIEPVPEAQLRRIVAPEVCYRAYEPTRSWLVATV